MLNDESEEGEFGSMDNVGQQMIREKSPSASPVNTPSPQENTRAQDNYMTTNNGFIIGDVDVQ